MQTSILIRTFVADGRAAHAPRRRRHHLAQRSGRGVGRDRRQGARPARRDRRRRGASVSGTTRPRHVWVDGRAAARRRHAPVGRSIAASSSATAIFETLRARGGHPTELAEHLARLRRSADGLAIALPGDLDALIAARHRGPARRRGPRRPGRRRLGPDHRVARRRSAAAGSCRPTRRAAATIVIQAWPVPAAAGRTTSSAGCTSSRPASGATRPTRSRRSRRRRAPTTSTRGSRRGGPAPTTRSS